jgi:hypothetical protein
MGSQNRRGVVGRISHKTEIWGEMEEEKRFPCEQVSEIGVG